MVEIKRLKRRIEIIEKKNKCSIDFKSAENLIGKISRDYRRGMSRQEFIILLKSRRRNSSWVSIIAESLFRIVVTMKEKNRNKTENSVSLSFKKLSDSFIKTNLYNLRALANILNPDSRSFLISPFFIFIHLSYIQSPVFFSIFFIKTSVYF